jgi:hypothetical protein
MAKTISCVTLKRVQAQMKAAETAIEPKDLNPILADALMLIKDKAYSLLQALTKRATDLPPGWEHIEDALVVQKGKSDKIASAFCKVFRRKAPQAIWIEFGHKMVGHKPGKKDTDKFVTANPFFRPAIDINRAAVRKKITEGIKQLIELSVGSGGVRQ